MLFERLGESGVAPALASFDDLYRHAEGTSPLAEVAERLAAADPADRSDVDITTYRGLRPPWNDWSHLRARGRHWTQRIAALSLGGTLPVPRFWLAALATLGEAVDWDAVVPDYYEATGI